MQKLIERLMSVEAWSLSSVWVLFVCVSTVCRLCICTRVLVYVRLCVFLCVFSAR